MAVYPAATAAAANISPIPIDLYVSKKRLRLDLKFTDASGNLVFRVDDDHKNSTSQDYIVLRDANGNPLILINRTNGGWQGFRRESRDDYELIFRVEKNRFQSGQIKELEVSLVGDYNKNNGENHDSIKSDLIKARGCRSRRSCTFYRGNSIMAQTSLLYTLGKVFVGRRKFRLTMFPGLPVDQALIVALVVIFLDRS